MHELVMDYHGASASCLLEKCRQVFRKRFGEEEEEDGEHGCPPIVGSPEWMFLLHDGSGKNEGEVDKFCASLSL